MVIFPKYMGESCGGFQAHGSQAEASGAANLPSKLTFPVSSQYLSQSLKSLKAARSVEAAGAQTELAIAGEHRGQDAPRWEMVIPKMARPANVGRTPSSAPDPLVRPYGHRPSRRIVQAFSLCKKIFRSLLLR